MKIVGAELIIRYHVRYSEAETTRLREIGHLPPTGSAPEVDMWMPMEDIKEYPKLDPIFNEADIEAMFVMQVPVEIDAELARVLGVRLPRII
jgi:hypothetical protein